ncbi:unnamed protein product, partial [Linum tenue]
QVWATAGRWTPPPPTTPSTPPSPSSAWSAVACATSPAPGSCSPAGCITYALYAWSFLYYNHSCDQTVIVVAGGILGVSGGMLQSVQGAVLRFAGAGVGFLHRGELELGIRWQLEEDTIDGEQSGGEGLIFIFIVFIINFQFCP